MDTGKHYPQSEMDIILAMSPKTHDIGWEIEQQFSLLRFSSLETRKNAYVDYKQMVQDHLESGWRVNRVLAYCFASIAYSTHEKNPVSD